MFEEGQADWKDAYETHHHNWPCDSGFDGLGTGGQDDDTTDSPLCRPSAEVALGFERFG